MRSVVLLSGGLDSCACLFMEASMGRQPKALHVSYGQRHAVEVTAARNVARVAGVNLAETSVSVDLGESLITGGSSDPVLPMRNAILASIAAAHAVKVGAKRVVIGSCVDDHEVFPDCRPAFVAALSRATELAVGVSVAAPLTTKAKAIEWCRGRPDAWRAMRLTWSCYAPRDAGARAPVPCEECLACTTRAAAFAVAGVSDPAVR